MKVEPPGGWELAENLPKLVDLEELDLLSDQIGDIGVEKPAVALPHMHGEAGSRIATHA